MNSSTNSTPSPTSNNTYCDYDDFKPAFRPYHLYLALLVCIFGSITNILNICVLTNKQMRSPTNLILTGLAIADLLVMLEYIPFVFESRVRYAFHFTYGLAVFVIFHALFTQAFHFISCCLTVILAIWRYVSIKFPQKNKIWCSNKRTKLTIFLTYILCPFVCIPLYLSLEIIHMSVPVDSEGKLLDLKALNTSRIFIYLTNYKPNDVFKIISFYIYGVVIKLVPCILLTVLSCLLIMELLRAKKRRQKLMGTGNGDKRRGGGNHKHLEKERQADRTTRMLLVVLLLFLMVEFPQAIFGLLIHIIGPKFEEECYRPLGDLIDVFAMTNSAISFVLYCTMSVKFRVVFKEIFFPYIPCYKNMKENWTQLDTLKTYV